MLPGVTVPFTAKVKRNFHLHLCYSQFVVCGERITYWSRAIHDVVIDISYPEKAFKD
jgi:hypothetical protein